MAQRFGEKLAQLRQQRSLTRTELATQLGFISRAHIANLEKGRDVPSLTIAVRLADHLGVSVDNLLRDNREIAAIASPIGPPAPHGDVQLPFGQQLRALRRARHMTQWQLEQDLQLVSRAYLSDLERGRRLPSIELLIRIADFFQVTIDSLVHIDHHALDTSSAHTSDEPPGSVSV
jgi:transcriptional regulator with XRE-family HTH domain